MRVRVFTSATKSPERRRCRGVQIAPAQFSRDLPASRVFEVTMTTPTLLKTRSSSILVVSLLLTACGNGVSSSADAEKAYLGLGELEANGDGRCEEAPPVRRPWL